jgi:hypothetical protein
VNKPVPLHMRLFNAAFRLPIPFKMKEKLAYSFLPPEKAKALKADFHGLVGGMNTQLGTYEALKEFAPNYAKWQEPAELDKIEGRTMVASGAASSICDFWTPKEVDLFFAKYVNSAEDHMGFCKTMFRIAFSMESWGYINGDVKNPIVLTDEEKVEMRETVWVGMSQYLSEEMPVKRTTQEWLTILKPLFYPGK